MRDGRPAKTPTTSKRAVWGFRNRDTYHPPSTVALHPANPPIVSEEPDGARLRSKSRFALLVERWRALQHVTLSPNKISKVALAALVLTHFEHDYLAW